MKLLFSSLALGTVIATGSACSGRPHDGKSLSTYGIVPERVARVEILYFPEDILTRAALTPARLESSYYYKVEIKEVAASRNAQLTRALREASVAPSDRPGDLRTAVLLYDNTGKRMASLYFDKGGRNGVLNHEVVSSNDAVYRWAKSIIRGFDE
jgi:hypothetical protein